MTFYFKKELKEKGLKGRSITYMANEIGYSRVHLYNILNAKTNCSHKAAFSITKFLDPNAEVEDYFDKK